MGKFHFWFQYFAVLSLFEVGSEPIWVFSFSDLFFLMFKLVSNWVRIHMGKFHFPFCFINFDSVFYIHGGIQIHQHYLID